MSRLSFAFSMPIGAWHPLLPAALRSLAIQNVELRLAILDASGDVRVRKALDESGIEFAYRREGPDGGQSAAIAEGWRNTDSDILGWLNVDDLLMPGALALAIEEFQAHPDAAAIFGDSVIIDEAGGVFRIHGQVADVDDHISVVNCISQPSCFFRRAAVDDVGGLDETLGYSMDWDLWIRMQRAGHRFVRVPDFLSAVYWGAQTKTAELSLSRVGELFSHTHRHSGLLQAFRMIMGVYTQAIMSAPWLLSRTGDIARKKAEQGLLVCADFNPRESGQPSIALPLVNVSLEPQSTLSVEFDGGACEVSTEASSDIQSVSPGKWEVRLEQSVAAGDAVFVSIASKGEAARLKRIAWV